MDTVGWQDIEHAPKGAWETVKVTLRGKTHERHLFKPQYVLVRRSEDRARISRWVPETILHQGVERPSTVNPDGPGRKQGGYWEFYAKDFQPTRFMYIPEDN